jgi:hypothetical protein
MMQEEIRFALPSRMSATLNRSLLGEPWRVDFHQGPPLFLETFKLFASEAGGLLAGRPDDSTNLEHWMERLFRFCQAEHQDYIALTFSSGGGSIMSACEASATFCTWLEREALDLDALGKHGVNERELRKEIAKAVETFRKRWHIGDDRYGGTVSHQEETKPAFKAIVANHNELGSGKTARLLSQQ